MKSIIILDSGLLGLLMQRRGLAVADAYRAWAASHIARGARLLVPEIADYEARRELLRLGNSSAIARLNNFNSAVPDLALST